MNYRMWLKLKILLVMGTKEHFIQCGIQQSPNGRQVKLVCAWPTQYTVMFLTFYRPIPKGLMIFLWQDGNQWIFHFKWKRFMALKFKIQILNLKFMLKVENIYEWFWYIGAFMLSQCCFGRSPNQILTLYADSHYIRYTLLS